MKNLNTSWSNIKSLLILFLFIFSVGVTITKSPVPSSINIHEYENRIKSLTHDPKLSNYSPRILTDIHSNSTESFQIPYTSNQNVSINVTSKKLVSINSSSTNDIVIRSTPQSSSFNIHSVVTEEKISWQNNIEPDYGEVDVIQNLSASTPYYRLNFSENNVTPVSGITNVDFNITSNPDPYNFSTNFLFRYRISHIDSGLINEDHSLVLELRFNNASLNFIIADKGSYFGAPLENNIYKPSTNSLYILCNETDQSNWITELYNITYLITQYFLPTEYTMFMNLKTVFCYMFAFIPEYSISLDIQETSYSTVLPANESAVNYTINEKTIQSDNGSLVYEIIGGNVSLFLEESSIWQKYQLTNFNVEINREVVIFTQPRVVQWNNSYVKVNLTLSIPQLIPFQVSNKLYLNLPMDWALINNLNSSVSFVTLGLLEIAPDNTTCLIYRFSVENLKFLILQFATPNYIQDIEVPTILSYNEVVQVEGRLIHSISNTLHLYLLNETVFHHTTTTCMLNGSFMFPMINIDDHYPIGMIELLVNISSSYRFGLYRQILHIHSGETGITSINLLTSENIELYQYDPLFLNLSLEKNGQKYIESSVLVIAVLGESIHQFNQSINGFFHLLITHVLWPSQQNNLTVIASNGEDFFASKRIAITIFPVVVDWDIQGVPTEFNPIINLSLQINMFVSPQEGGTNWPLSEVKLTYWINSSMTQECYTNDFGYSNVIIPTNTYTTAKILNLLVIAHLKNTFLKMDLFSISVSNFSNESDRVHPNLNEIMRDPVYSNKSFFIFYNIIYPENGSLWIISSNKYPNPPISAFLLRDNYILEITINSQSITWDLISNPSNNDTLVLEFQGPTITYSLSNKPSSYDLHLECLSDFTISNYCIALNLDFIKFPLSNITLRDFLRRDISDKFVIELIGSYLYLKDLNIINGIIVNYYLEIQFEIPQVEILSNFQESYAYNETIVGKWRFSTSTEFSYKVSYTLQNRFHSECRNTSFYSLMNNTYIIEAHFQNFKWNTTVNVTLEVIFSNGFHSISPEQMFSIIDPFPPEYSYFIDFRDESFDLHLLVSESDEGSGVHEIDCTYFGIQYNSTLLTPGHHLFEIPFEESQIGKINVLISDKAGNNSSFTIDLNLEIEFPSSKDKADPSIFLPSVLSLLIISVIFSVKFVRRRQKSIL